MANEGLDEYFEQIKGNAKEALENMNNFKFFDARHNIEAILHFCDKIRPVECLWCGLAHKTENCPLRSKDGGFYHNIAYTIQHDKELELEKAGMKDNRCTLIE